MLRSLWRRLTGASLNEELQAAIFWKDEARVEKLLRKGADPNSPAGQQTLLGLAVFRGSLPIVRLLLTAGADPREPYYIAGAEYRLSYMAQHFGLPELAQVLEAAELDAEARLGPRPLKSHLRCQNPRLS
jgi:ankyrin repeat protein